MGVTYMHTQLTTKQTLLLPTALALVFALLCTSCSVQSDINESGDFFKRAFSKDTYSLYRMDISQGNTINADKLRQLKRGMTKEQTRYLLGNPVSNNVFRKNRWDYIYYLIPGKGKVQHYRLVLLFDENHLQRIYKSKTLLPSEANQPEKSTKKKNRKN